MRERYLYTLAFSFEGCWLSTSLTHSKPFYPSPILSLWVWYDLSEIFELGWKKWLCEVEGVSNPKHTALVEQLKKLLKHLLLLALFGWALASRNAFVSNGQWERCCELWVVRKQNVIRFKVLWSSCYDLWDMCDHKTGYCSLIHIEIGI